MEDLRVKKEVKSHQNNKITHQQTQQQQKQRQNENQQQQEHHQKQQQEHHQPLHKQVLSAHHPGKTEAKETVTAATSATPTTTTSSVDPAVQFFAASITPKRYTRPPPPPPIIVSTKLASASTIQFKQPSSPPGRPKAAEKAANPLGKVNPSGKVKPTIGKVKVGADDLAAIDQFSSPDPNSSNHLPRPPKPPQRKKKYNRSRSAKPRLTKTGLSRSRPLKQAETRQNKQLTAASVTRPKIISDSLKRIQPVRPKNPPPGVLRSASAPSSKRPPRRRGGGKDPRRWRPRHGAAAAPGYRVARRHGSVLDSLERIDPVTRALGLSTLLLGSIIVI